MMYHTRWLRVIATLLAIVGVTALAQAQPGWGRGRGPQVVSPQLQNDGSVQFQLLAANAQSVSLVSPDLGGMPKPGEMTQNDQGIWSLTYGPVDPPIAMRYRFNVDGVNFADPSARGTSEANGTVFSLVYVPGLKFQDVQDVPHGAVAEVTYYSKVLGRFRRMHVYTPPGYESGQNAYPVFYLLHGASDSDDSWSTIGRANVILDNLIAAGEAVPMLVVMPDGHVTRAGVPNTGGSSFEEEFSRDIRPTIEKTYRVDTDRAHRAIAGLSMGGAQTLNIAMKDLADYGYIGVFSSGIFGRNRNGQEDGPSWEEQHVATLDNAALKQGLKVLWFATGREDFLLETSRNTVAMFRKHGFDVMFKETEGAHWWRNWRPYLHEFAPLLFQRTAASSDATTTEKKAFSLGADISFVEGREGRYRDNGVEKDICQIMADHHFNNIRLRVFVNPKAERGYSRQGACGLEATVAMAKRIKAAGMAFTLDFHYSDTWADPDKQFKPSAWEGLTGKDLENALYEYTKTALTTLKDAGAAPDVVQIGNEINHGMVWPDGKLMDNATEENWQALMTLYKAGQRAVRETLPDAKIMIHLALGGENTLCRAYLDEMVKYNAEFDIVGLSYYEKWHETYEDLKANLYDLAERYHKPLCICEYGANRDNIKIMVHIACGGQNEESVAFFDKIISRDVTFDVIGESYYPRYHGTLEELRSNLNDLAARYRKPVVVVEYQEYRKEVNEIVKSVPNGLGWGTFIWEATNSRWGNLFDRNGATNENMAVYPEFLENYNHSAPEEITVTRDIPYREGDSEAWQLDMAMPAEPGGGLRPALVIVHGGGWRGGSRTVDVFQNMMTEYARKGYVTINIDYRLIDEAPFPACIEDVKCAVRWLRAHAKVYRVDPDRIGAYGHSAGAHLAMMLAMVTTSAGLEGDGGWDAYSSRVNVAAAGSPPTELGRNVPMAKTEWWPIGYISADQPPLFLIQGSDDRIVRAELTDDFVEKMRDAGASIQYLKVDGVGHAVAYNKKLDVTDPAIEAFFAKYLKK